MADTTGIEWTDATWNPIRGCSRVSEGCRNCYAEGVAYRFSGPGGPYEGLVRIGADGRRRREWNGQIRFVEKQLLDPLRWKEPRRIFVNSMSDLFHENVTDEMLDQIFAVMALCPQHTFQVLTKRPDRMLAYWLKDPSDRRGRQLDWIHRNPSVEPYYRRWEVRWQSGKEPEFDLGIIAQNVWLGVSVENQNAANERIPLLLKTPAAVRFISAEPLLGPISLAIKERRSAYSAHGTFEQELGTYVTREPVASMPGHPHSPVERVGAKLDWVICGGESGNGARPMHPGWARGLRDQCVAAGVPFFFKQWGEWMPNEMCSWTQSESCDNGEFHRGERTEFILGCLCCEGDPHANLRRVGKKAAGDLLDGKQWHQFPNVSRDTFCSTRGEL